MAFRTVEITHSSEIHVKNGQLHIEQDEGEAIIPVEDIAVVVCIGANIRLSTMGMSKLAEAGVLILTIDESYKPVAMVCPCLENSRQALVMNRQVQISNELKNFLWQSIVKQKIDNQGRSLSILGLDGAQQIFSHIECVDTGDTGNIESLAAREYFEFYHPGMNRRTDDPINSCLNYGYAVLRSAITRSLIGCGFIVAIGIHHHSQLNSFNLADDIIEPWRPMVDVIAHSIVGSNTRLSTEQRRRLACVLHNACLIDGQKTTILAAIDVMTVSLKQSVMEGKNILKVPTILPVEELSLITE